MLNEFEQYLQANGKSELTIRVYIRQLKKALTMGVINEFLTELNFNNLDKRITSKNQQIAAIKKYAKFLYVNNYIESIPRSLEHLETKKVPNKIINLPEKERVQKSIHSYDVETNTLLHILYYTGARIDSISHLRVEDVSPNKIVFNTAKRDKPYECYIPDECYNQIQKFIEGKSGWVFKSKGKRATASCLRSRLRRRMRGEYINPHMYRHYLASNLIEHGVDVLYVAEILNHSNINTTKKYVHMNTMSKKKIYDDIF